MTGKTYLLKVIGARHSGASFDFLLRRLLDSQVFDLDHRVRGLLIFLLIHWFILLLFQFESSVLTLTSSAIDRRKHFKHRLLGAALERLQIIGPSSRNR